MAEFAPLTGFQSPPPPSSFYTYSDSGANDPRAQTDHYSSNTDGAYRGPVHNPPVRLARKSSLQAVQGHATSTSNGGSSSRSSKSRTPSISRIQQQHARQLSLQHSLEKPLPEPPAHTSPTTTPTTTLPVFENISESFAESFAATDTPQPRFVESRLDNRLGVMDSTSSAVANQMYSASGQDNIYMQEMNSNMSGLSSARYGGGGDEYRDGQRDGQREGYREGHREGQREGQRDREGHSQGLTPRSNGSVSAGMSPAIGGPAQAQTPSATPVGGPSQGSSAHLSGLMCNVHRTTGQEPPPLVGATTTILGDSLYVFGGRILSRSRPAPLTSDLYELDLIRRHWTRLEVTGDIPPPRYFHSMCPLGGTKMVCYGGMSPAPNQPMGADQQQPEVTVMSDIHIYDAPTKRWSYVPAQDSPQGRYAHCACILSSSATFSSKAAPLSALQHNPSNGNPNEGRIGINIDGSGGAQLIVVGGQDGGNHYIEQISVFNLRSLKWTTNQPLGKSCGAYRSVAASLPPAVSARIGMNAQNGQQRNDSTAGQDPGSSMLIYSNYNFLDVKLELQIRSPDGTLTERPMSGTYSPPGLRFPNGGIIDTHFVVSGTYLTSSKQEYALWALDLRTLTWSRIDAGGSVFSQGSWNRGVLWNRRNTFVILGNRKRSLVDDYNHRRINFSNVCMVELEAFGFYDNPRKTDPMSGFVSASSPYFGMSLSLARKAGSTAGGRFHSRASEDLGEKILGFRELADMDILCIGGERIPVNSRIVARRWGPYFVQLLREGTATQDGSDAVTLRSGLSSNPLRTSALTITPNNRNFDDSATLVGSVGGSVSGPSGLSGPIHHGIGNSAHNNSNNNANTNNGDELAAAINVAPTPRSLMPSSRPRCLYLPHTYLTILALLHFLYTSSLPSPTSSLCTPQILCSLLQIARPYRIDGLLEAVVERLHALLDSRNAAAVFNATAMAAGGGRGIDGSLNPNFFVGSLDPVGSPVSTSDFSFSGTTANDSFSSDLASRTASLSLGANLQHTTRSSSGEASASTSTSGSEWGSEIGDNERDGVIWNGELSSVIGLQKRGLRGLMEGRRMRERTGTGTGGAAGMGANGIAGYGGQAGGPAGGQAGGQRVGLGIAGP